MTLQEALMYAYQCACELGDTHEANEINKLYITLFGRNETKKKTKQDHRRQFNSGIRN